MIAVCLDDIAATASSAANVAQVLGVTIKGTIFSVIQDTIMTKTLGVVQMTWRQLQRLRLG